MRAREVRLRSLVHYAGLEAFLDDEWIIQQIRPNGFDLYSPRNGFSVLLADDARREWTDDGPQDQGTKRGFLTLKVQITLIDERNGSISPLSNDALNKALERQPRERMQL